MNIVTLYNEAVSAALEKERLIAEIAVLAQVQVDEVKEYYRSHTLTPETIRAAVSMGLALDDDLWDNYKRAKIAGKNPARNHQPRLSTPIIL